VSKAFSEMALVVALKRHMPEGTSSLYRRINLQKEPL
jgi:hypothetical protein